jgi:hypothetical protein
MNIELLKTKTFWSAVAAIIAAIGAMATKAIQPAEGIAAIWAAAQTIFLRDALAKNGK